MKIFTQRTQFDFLGKRKLAYIFSGTLLAVSILSLAVQQLNFGLDFTGGTLIELKYADSVELGDVRSVLQQEGYDDTVVQHFGTTSEVLVRVAPQEGVSSSESSNKIIAALRATYHEVQAESSVTGAQKCLPEGATTPVDCQVQMQRVEFVGPQVGDELAEDGGLALIYALVGILIYVAFRFEYRFALGAVAALIHDVIITLGLFSIFQLDFDLTVLAALLAVIGYSLNDTIVVFDRIRENFRKMRKGTTEEVVNNSLNQTLSRTIMTSLTTLLVLVALFIFGGDLIHNFALALIVGIVIGTYSSIYVASAAAIALGISKADLAPVKKEGADMDMMP